MAAEQKKGRGKRRSRLISPLALLLITAILVLALILLFPEKRFNQLIASIKENENPSGEVSLDYLKALLRDHPNDSDLRYKLARRQARTGQLAKARATLEPLSGSHARNIVWLRMNLAWQAFTAATPGNPARQQRRGDLIAALRNAQTIPNLDVDQLQVLAKHWLSLGEPGQAARLYERLARRQPEHAYHWYAKAARWWLAANNPSAAAQAWRQASIHTSDPDQSRKAAFAALKAARQNDNASGVALAARFIRRYPNDPTFLNIGVDMALARNRLDRARRWSARYLALRPNDQNARIRDTRIALAQNRMGEALAGLERMVADHPNDHALRAKLAQVQVWAGQPRAALANYKRAARGAHSNAYDQQIIDLGEDLHDTGAVLAALDRIQRRHGLSASQRTLLIDTLDREGRPERAIRVLRNRVHSGRADRDTWVRLATMQEYTGDTQGALQTWRAIASRYGRALDETRARARLLARQWQLQKALAVLRSLPDKPIAQGQPPVAYWQTMGELAWNLNEPDAARKAYYQLYLARQLEPNDTARLVQAAAQTGHIDMAMQVTRTDWREHHDPRVILGMLDAAERAQRPALIGKLLALAAHRPRLFAHSADYWQFYGSYHFDRQDFEKARRGYSRALALRPGDPSLRSAMLYVLAETDRRDQLQRALNAWREDARHEPLLWQAYAAGYKQLGESHRALPWYDRAIRAQPKNYLLVLDYADTLARDKHFVAARRMRRYALKKLRPRLLRDLRKRGLLSPARRRENARIVRVQAAMLGPDQAHGLVGKALAGKDKADLDAVDMEMLLDYYLAREQPPYARYWLLRAQQRRLATQPWQQLVVALEHNDQVAIEDILHAHPSGGGIGVADRVQGLRKLDYRERALVLALNHTRPREPFVPGIHAVPRYAAELYRAMPQNYGTQLRITRISDLDVTSESAFLRLSGERLSTRVQLGARQLNDTGLNLDLEGLDHERFASLALDWHERRGQTTFRIGTVATDAKDLLQLGLRQDWQLTGHLNGAVFARHNTLPDETGQLRALGVRDDYGAALDWSFDARDTASLTGAYSRFYTREDHNTLGHGYRLSASIAHALILGPTHELQVRGFANTEQNTLANDLPDDVGDRLPAGSDVNTLLPPHFTFVGAGFSIARGTPGSEYPVVASPRYRFELDTGYVLPDNQLGVSASFSIGTRVFGSDELSLELGVDQTGGQTRQNTYTGLIRYRYFLGR